MRTNNSPAISPFFSLALLALAFFTSLLPISCKTVSRTPSAKTAAAPGATCYGGGYTTCIEPYQGKHLVCDRNGRAVICATCSSERDSFPDDFNDEFNASTNQFHDYAKDCEAAPTPIVSPTAPPAPSPSNSNTMVFGFNIHDVQQHHYYEQRLGDGPGQLSYKEPGKSVYVLHRAISDHSNYMDGVNRAIEIARAKGDLLIIRFDYRDGSTVPSPQDSEEKRQGFYQKVDSLLANPGIAYVQVGNEPNLDYECEKIAAHCQPNVYVPVLQRYKGHGKFISAPWGPTEHLALSKPWEWALGSLSGNCPVNIGIHAYPALGAGDRAKTTASQFIAMNLKYIWEAGCRNSNIFITELNGNMGGDKHEWVAALKAARTGIDWINN